MDVGYAYSQQLSDLVAQIVRLARQYANRRLNVTISVPRALDRAGIESDLRRRLPEAVDLQIIVHVEDRPGAMRIAAYELDTAACE
jgi:hypothetical protein